jgi:hypothetical protein
MSEQDIEKLARAMTIGDPDRLVQISYDRVVGRSDGGGPPRSIRQIDMVAAWRLHAAEARMALCHVA